VLRTWDSNGEERGFGTMN